MRRAGLAPSPVTSVAAMVAYALTGLYGVLATMILLIIPEAIGRSRARDRRRRTGRPWLHPIRWTRRTFAPLRRSFQVRRAVQSLRPDKFANPRTAYAGWRN